MCLGYLSICYIDNPHSRDREFIKKVSVYSLPRPKNQRFLSRFTLVKILRVCLRQVTVFYEGVSPTLTQNNLFSNPISFRKGTMNTSGSG